jgi:hypothetical protein
MDISNSCEPDGINSAIHPLICIAISVVVTRGSTAKTFLIGMFRDSRFSILYYNFLNINKEQ